MNELERSPSILCDYNINEKIVRREKENQMWEDREEEIFRNFTDLRKNCGKQRDSVNERFKKRGLTYAVFSKINSLGRTCCEVF